MTTAQKVIKYLALALAAFIIINIVSACFFGLFLFGSMLGLTSGEEIGDMVEESMSIHLEESVYLDVDLEFSSLEIRWADEREQNLLIEKNNKEIVCTQQENKISIVDKEANWFARNDERKVIVYLPIDIKLEKVTIQAGAGTIYIEEMETNELELEIGAGTVEIENLQVLQKAKIEGGAGKTDILNGKIHKLDLDAGIGKFYLRAALTGYNKINMGIGKLDLELLGNEEEYSIKADKGIGSVTLNGEELSADREYGSGQNTIDIDGGIGSISVTTQSS